MEKIAVISDIHGNLEALKLVIKDIKSRNIDRIFCLGDIIAKGTHSSECISLIRENCEVVIQGNCDRYFTEKHDLDKVDPVEKQRIIWNNSMISEDDKEDLRNLPFSYELYISGSLIRLFHATPISDAKVILNLDSVQDKIAMFDASEKTISNNVADIVIYGHIHHQYMDKLYNKTIINTGSVGNSFDVIRDSKKDSSVLETTNAHYLIIEGDINSKQYGSSLSFGFRRVPYDIKKELEDINLNPEQDNYKFEIEQGKYRDIKKVKKILKLKGIDIIK